jgi:crossover junction endodeoxyribonuclease RuvC
MRILGIDPGTVLVGFGCLEVEDLPAARSQRPGTAELPAAHRAQNVVCARSARTGARFVEAGVIPLGRAGSPIATRLGRLAEELSALLLRLLPAEVALESAFYGKSVTAALRIGEARGVILAEAHRAGVAVFQFSPAKIKRCLTGHGAASKATVAAMAQMRLGLTDVPARRDATDALAVAFCRSEHRLAASWSELAAKT